MGDHIKTVGIWIVALVCTIFMLNYILTSVQINNQNQAIEETLQTTLLSNQQYSERVESKAFYINKPNFEKAFLNDFSKNKNIKVKSSQVEFAYLPSKYSKDADAISGAKVKIISDGQTYQGTILIDTGSDK
jgi:Na+-translocating ferredoxin:NAD+ oxidoreductase RnfG subunit